MPKINGWMDGENIIIFFNSEPLNGAFFVFFWQIWNWAPEWGLRTKPKDAPDLLDPKLAWIIYRASCRSFCSRCNRGVSVKWCDLLCLVGRILFGTSRAKSIRGRMPGTMWSDVRARKSRCASSCCDWSLKKNQDWTWVNGALRENILLQSTFLIGWGISLRKYLSRDSSL